MAMFAIAFPILPGRTDAWKAFINELGTTRKAEFEASRAGLGVRERTFLQPTPMGDFVVVTLEGDNPAHAFAAFGQGTDPFTTWFKEQVLLAHGVDLGAPPAGPLPEQVLDSGPIPAMSR
jgi:hypothetical protein